MTPSEQWILGLWAVYGIPSFLFGVGSTLLFVRRRAGVAAMLNLLSPDRTFEQVAPTAPRLTATAERGDLGLAD